MERCIRAISLSTHRSMPDLGSKLQATIGGLSVTGVLEDFSLYVFHPYGGKQRGAGGAPYLATSPLAALTDGERKDSLSVMVEFVKLHISRSRKINFKSEGVKMKASGGSDSSKAIIRFSSKFLCASVKLRCYEMGGVLFHTDTQLADEKQWQIMMRPQAVDIIVICVVFEKYTMHIHDHCCIARKTIKIHHSQLSWILGLPTSNMT